jgi:hypothetical protein
MGGVEVSMRADRAEVSWDPAKSKWLVRIESGDEYIRRYCNLPKNATEAQLRSAAEQTVHDDGYELDPTLIAIRR